MKERHHLLGIHVTDRVHKAVNVQTILTEFGCHIRTRLGLHEAGTEVCAPSGLIVLELVGENTRCEELRERLAAIDGLEVQEMIFEHA